MPVTKVKSDWTSGSLRFRETVAGNGAQVLFGEDATGLDVKMFGATTAKYWLWDESADGVVLVGSQTQTGNSQLTGTLTVGVNDTGHDVKFFGATASKYWMWDESADQMILVGSSAQTGNAQLTGTLTVGVNDTGHDVKFFGATASKYMEWDESADTLNVAGTLAVTTADLLTVGGIIVPQHFYVSFSVPAGAAAADFDGVIPVPDAAQVVSVTERHQTAGNDAGAVTLMVAKVPSGTAKAAGTDCLSAGISLKATADTNQAGALHGTAANYQFAAGDGVALVTTGTLTAVDGVTVTVKFKRI